LRFDYISEPFYLGFRFLCSFSHLAQWGSAFLPMRSVVWFAIVLSAETAGISLWCVGWVHNASMAPV
jgi:hypothetical protein